MMIKQESLQEFLSVPYPDGQKQLNSQLPSFSILSPSSVMVELEKLLQETEPSLSGEALRQKVLTIYRQIEPSLPYNHYQKLEISSQLVRSLVLHALRKSGNSLGVQNQDDVLLSEWLSCFENSNIKLQTVSPLGRLLHLRQLLKNGASEIFAVFRDMTKRVKVPKISMRLKGRNS